MTCAEVQLLLSEYIEKSLDTIRMKAVETHLLTCSGCRAETEGLMDCIRQISELPLLDPPIGFTQRVMAHVREIESTPSGWRRVLAPFRLGAPIQATALVLVAVVAVFLYQKESQIRGNPASSAIPSILPSQPLSDDRANDHSAGKPEQSRAAAEPTPESPKRSSPTASAIQPASAEVRKAAAGTEQVKTKTPSPSNAEPSSAGDVKNPVSRRGPIQAQEVATGMGGLQSSADSFRFGQPIGGSARPGFFLPERFLSPIAERSADIEFIVRRRETQRHDQDGIARSESARQSAESDIAPTIAKQSPASPSSSSSPVTLREIRWFSVPADQYDEFRKDLASEASIDSEKTIAPSEREFAQKSNRELLIKVIIVSPVER